MPFWAQSASGCARQFSQASETLAFCTSPTPVELAWRSQSMSVPKKARRCLRSFPKILRQTMPQKRVVSRGTFEVIHFFSISNGACCARTGPLGRPIAFPML